MLPICKQECNTLKAILCLCYIHMENYMVDINILYYKTRDMYHIIYFVSSAFQSDNWANLFIIQLQNVKNIAPNNTCDMIHMEIANLYSVVFV